MLVFAVEPFPFFLSSLISSTSYAGCFPFFVCISLDFTIHFMAVSFIHHNKEDLMAAHHSINMLFTVVQEEEMT